MAPPTPRGTRQVLIQAAGELLENEGLDAVTLRALGAAAGVSRTAPYRHFTDKAELLALVATDGLRDLREAMAEGSRSEAARDRPVERVEAALAAYVTTALERPAHYRLIFGAEVAGREHPELAAEGAAAFDLLAELVAGALDPPGEDSALAVSAVLFSAAHGVVDLTLSGHATPRKGLADPLDVIRLAVAHAWPAGARARAGGTRRPARR